MGVYKDSLIFTLGKTQQVESNYSVASRLQKSNFIAWKTMSRVWKTFEIVKWAACLIDITEYVFNIYQIIT